MGLDDLGKQTVSAYKKWFTHVTDKADTYVNDIIETLGDPLKYNGLTTKTIKKSSITSLTDNLNDVQKYKEDAIKRINNAFEKAQKVDGDIIDEIRPIYQQALDKINASVENVSIYEQQLVGLKNAEKYKEGTKAFNRGFNSVRGEELVRQEIDIENIWDRDSKAQQKLYDDINKHYTQTYHPEIENRTYFSERTSSFLDDKALKQYDDLKQMAPGIIVTEQSYKWETDINKAHESALRENKQFDLRQAEEKARRYVDNNTNSATAQNQVNREPKKRRKSYADRKTKPIESEFNTTFYGQYNMQAGTYEYVDYKSHYSGGVSRSKYDKEWIDEKIFGEAHSASEYGIEAPWSTNRTRRSTNTSNIPNTPDVPNTSSTPKVRKLKNATKSYRPETIVDGNNIEFDSIYNHSVPKKINKNNNPIPEVNVNNVEPEVNVNNNVETQPQPNFDPSDPNTWTDKDIETIRQSDPDYADELEELRRNNTVNTPPKTAFNPEDTSTWTDEDLLNIKNTDPDYYDELMELRNQGAPNTAPPNTTPPNTETPKIDPELEKARLNKERAEEAYKKAMEQINSKTDLERLDFYNTTPGERAYQFGLDNPNATEYKDLNGYQGNKVNEQVKNFVDKNANAEEFIEKNFDNLDNGKINKDSIFTGEYTSNTRYTDDAGNLIKTRRTVKSASEAGVLKDVSKVGLVTTGINVISTIGDYKDERKKGHGVISSAARAGAKFAMYEALGLWSIPVALVSNVPGAVIKGADILYKENRKMNSAANFEAFGGAQFMDTQQLATMRQSGMEMAKMANYNLQQTLMGNEATYLHR